MPQHDRDLPPARLPGGPSAAQDRPVTKAGKKRKVRVCVWISPELHDRLKRAAGADERPMSGFLIRVLRRALDEFEARSRA